MLRDFQILTQAASDASRAGRPPSSVAAGSQYSESKLVKVRAPVARSTRLPSRLSFQGNAAENDSERMMKIADSV